MPDITIHKKIESDYSWQFNVRVSDGGDTTEHLVTLSTMTYKKLTGGQASPDDLIIKSFEFLLKHEPKESILPMFELDDIADYFPDWWPSMVKYFS